MGFFKSDSGDKLPITTFLHMAFRVTSRLLQFVLSLTIIGLYGSTMKAHHFQSEWIFGVLAGTLSAITALVYFVPKLSSYKFWAWDLILWIFFIGVFGSFGATYIHPKGKNAKSLEGDHNMRNAVWVDAVLMVLWFMTGVCGLALWLHRRRQDKKAGGAAHV